MQASVILNDVSLKFRVYHEVHLGLNERVMYFLTPPAWTKGRKQSSTFWGLKNVNLHIKEGDRIGIIGNNGAGKSTLLKVMSRIYQPTSGSIATTGTLAPLIEVGAGFHPELTGRENTFLNAAILGIPKPLIRSRLNSIIEFSELQDFIDTPVKYYSTGMYLRLAFTIATEISPDILILDELYAGGDPHFVRKANQRLESFVNQTKILILVSHQLEYVSKFCNRVIVVSKGAIVKDGPPEECIDFYLNPPSV